MSLIGENIAFVSLGSSCQVAHQLRLHAATLSYETGQDLQHRRLPFDWIIAPIEKLTGMLDSGVHFPSEPGHLRPHSGQVSARYWPDAGVFFWHDFFDETGAINVQATFESTRQQYEQHFSLLRKLASKKIIVLVVANTQNNLPTVLGDQFQGFEFTLDRLRSLKIACERYVGRRCLMLAVTYQGLADDTLASDASTDIEVRYIARDPSEWEGDSAIWLDVLKDYIRSRHELRGSRIGKVARTARRMGRKILRR